MYIGKEYSKARLINYPLTQKNKLCTYVRVGKTKEQIYFDNIPGVFLDLYCTHTRSHFVFYLIDVAQCTFMRIPVVPDDRKLV